MTPNVCWKRAFNSECSLGAYWPSDVSWKGTVNSGCSMDAYWLSNVSWKRTDNSTRSINHLPNDVDGNSSYTASNGWMTVNNKLEMMRKWSWPNLWYYSGIFLETLRKPQNLCTVCVPCPNSNLHLLNTFRIVTTWLPYSVHVSRSMFVLRLWSSWRHVVWQGV
jgi:hypothetical protein